MTTDPRVEAARTPEERTRLAEIEARLAAATPGPWEMGCSTSTPAAGRYIHAPDPTDPSSPWTVAETHGGLRLANNEEPHNAILIANAPADLAYLRARLDEAQSLLADVAEDNIVPGTTHREAVSLLARWLKGGRREGEWLGQSLIDDTRRLLKEK